MIPVSELGPIPVLSMRQWVNIVGGLDSSRLPAGYLAKVVAFAIRVDRLPSLMDSLEAVSRLGKNSPEGLAYLTPDFAPYSFTWLAPDMMNGGLIYHGPHDGEDGNSATFTVSLSSTDGWSVHT